MNTVAEENDEQQQTYQNLAELNEQAIAAASTSSHEDIYANQNQIFHGQGEGIYDNDCIITAQMKSAAATVKVAQPSESIISTAAAAPNKPPVAHKPSALQAKIQALNNAGLSVSSVDKYIPPLATASQPSNEPLKIVENEQELYSNTKILSQK